MKKFRPILYTVLIVFFAILSYIFICVGINIKNKITVKYQNDSNINYIVYLLDNDIYEYDYLGMNEKYVTELVDYFKFDFKYDIMYDEDINGYYSYNVDASLVAYEDDINDILFEKKYNILDDKVTVIDKNHVNKINIIDKVIIDYREYKEILDDFSDKYGVDVDGYLKVKFNVYTKLDFSSLEQDVEDTKSMEVMIPINDNTFKVKILNTYDDIDSYDDFSKKSLINYIYVIIGLFCLSISLTFIVMLIRELMIISKGQSWYNKELKRILKEYDDDIIIVNKFYNKKKYNLIYVDSFDELLDVYNKVGSPITYKEVKKNYKSIFVIINDDNAWIYRMVARNK